MKGTAAMRTKARTQESAKGVWGKEVGQRIKDALNEKDGMTQRSLSDQMGITERAVSAWVTGETIPFRHLAQLEEILGKDRRWILYGDNPPDGSREQEIIDKLDQIIELLKRR